MIQYSHLDSPMSPQSFLSIIARRFKLIMLSFLIIVGAVTAVTFLLPPLYEASSRVIVSYQDDYEKAMHPSSARLPYDAISTELAIMKARTILEPVVVNLRLDSSNVSEQETSPQLLHEHAVARLMADLKVELDKDTAILVVSYADEDPERAAKVVNEAVRQYMQQRPSLSKDESAVKFLNNQIQELEQRIDSLELKSQIYKSKSQVLAPEKQSQILFTTLADFDQEITRVRTERIAKESRLRVIKQQLENGSAISIPVTEASNSLSKMEYLNQLRKTLLDLQLKKNQLAQKYTEKHPDMIAVTSDIKNTEAKIQKEINEIIQLEETDVKAIRAQERELNRARAQVTNSIADLSRKEYELGKHTISIDELKNVHAALVSQREQAFSAARKKEHLVQARILEEAVVPFKPSSPNKKLYLALGVVLGSVVSVAAAFFVEYFDHSVHTAEDAQNCLGLPILATIQDVHPESFKQIELRSEKRIVFKSLD